MIKQSSITNSRICCIFAHWNKRQERKKHNINWAYNTYSSTENRQFTGHKNKHVIEFTSRGVDCLCLSVSRCLAVPQWRFDTSSSAFYDTHWPTHIWGDATPRAYTSLARKKNKLRKAQRVLYLQTGINKHRPPAAHIPRTKPRFLHLLLTRSTGRCIIFIRNSKLYILQRREILPLITFLCAIVSVKF